MTHPYTIIADLHTHTLASNHAYSTVTEMVRAAGEKGLYALAVTGKKQRNGRDKKVKYGHIL